MCAKQGSACAQIIHGHIPDEVPASADQLAHNDVPPFLVRATQALLDNIGAELLLRETNELPVHLLFHLKRNVLRRRVQ